MPRPAKPARHDASDVGVTYPADRFVDELLGAGFDWFGGVPCSLIAPVIAELERRQIYLGDTREDAALGAAAGAYMAGRLPMVAMQNSGLGVSLNAIGSLQQLYEIPVLLLITWRGFEGHDAPEHLVMGDVLPRLLDLFGIPWRAPDYAGLAGDVVWAAETMRATRNPVALVVKPGLFAEHK
jgi:sulfopyruvate decarboxylase subunit alpha